MPTLGVCEDDPVIRRVLAEALGAAGYALMLAHTGAEAVALFAPGQDVDVIVLDIGLPDAAGGSVRAVNEGRHGCFVLSLPSVPSVFEPDTGRGRTGTS